MASQFGLKPGFAYDLVVSDESGNPWDVYQPEQRNKCPKHVMKQKPQLLIGSPMCTAFSALQGLNKWRMSPAKWDAFMEKRMRHIRFASNLYRL